ncbi:MAG: c-type cytochrome [Candidatus Rokuibacteriota bacterium]
MSESRHGRRRIVLGGLAIVALAGCASMEEPKKMTAAEAISERQELMKGQGAAMRAIQEKVKTGQIQAIATDAEALAKSAPKINALFPPGSLNPNTSRAKPEIWQKWPEFEGNAKALETKATALAVTARTGNAQATAAAVGELGKTTCGACHNAFRGPEIKK